MVDLPGQLPYAEQILIALRWQYLAVFSSARNFEGSFGYFYEDADFRLQFICSADIAGLGIGEFVLDNFNKLLPVDPPEVFERLEISIDSAVEGWRSV